MGIDPDYIFWIYCRIAAVTIWFYGYNGPKPGGLHPIIAEAKGC